jgi:hypothetical protein
MSRQVTNNLHGTEAFWEADSLLSGHIHPALSLLWNPSFYYGGTWIQSPNSLSDFLTNLLILADSPSLSPKKVHSDFLTKILYAVCWSFLSCSFVQPPVTSSSFGPNSLLSMFFSNILSRMAVEDDGLLGHYRAQVVSPRPLTKEVRVRARDSMCGICGW